MDLLRWCQFLDAVRPPAGTGYAARGTARPCGPADPAPSSYGAAELERGIDLLLTGLTAALDEPGAGRQAEAGTQPPPAAGCDAFRNELPRQDLAENGDPAAGPSSHRPVTATDTSRTVMKRRYRDAS